MREGMAGNGSRHERFCCVTRGLCGTRREIPVSSFRRVGYHRAARGFSRTATRAFMLFNSFDFLIFLVVVLALLRVSRHSVQNWILLAASCFFYGWWDWRGFVGVFF